MAVTREWVASLPDDNPKKEHYKLVLKDMMDNDEWIDKVFKDTAVILTSHPGNRIFLKSSIESYKKLNLFTLLTYDNYWDPKNKSITYEQCLPYRDVFDLADSFLISKHHTWAGVMMGYFMQLYQGISTLSNYEYVLCSNGDITIEKPEGFKTIYDTLVNNNGDIYPCGFEVTPHGREILNTTVFIAKTKSIQKIMVHFRDNFLGMDRYEKSFEEFGNTESRFAIACRDLNLKVIKPEKNPIDTQISGPGGTWYDVLGIKHAHAEHNIAFRKKRIPPHYKYYDERYQTEKVNIIKQYYNEQDPVKKQQHLEKFWASK